MTISNERLIELSKHDNELFESSAIASELLQARDKIAELEKASKQLKYLRHKYPVIIADLLTRYAPKE